MQAAKSVIALQQLGRQLYQTVGVFSGRQALGGGDGDFEVVLGIFLPDEIGQGTRPEAVIQGCVFYIWFTGNYAGDGWPPLKISIFVLIL